jgi:hypothetical protein
MHTNHGLFLFQKYAHKSWTFSVSEICDRGLNGPMISY